ncbi:hypothetical protein GCM10011375_07280 [Hymenobacter qilianensis]|uniref:Uncharacterized protein n=2 Tax=Hymenobacter qilianensis TaxID=1385715 RepID=A0ACB5PMW9_9BACT|nr:hypothetical protein [Hymenobacter qilianensis]QNP53632.1 hypothetical protein H9L05_08805 [Hymenobacter qilianensis]GGF54445.1 hypothetical protein GCM10011375_07280 [Hymenobacter qilianensis]
MSEEFIKFSGWAIAAASLVVNILQLLKNNDLKKEINSSTQTVGANARANQQTSSGSGSNYASGRDINVGK